MQCAPTETTAYQFRRCGLQTPFHAKCNVVLITSGLSAHHELQMCSFTNSGHLRWRATCE